MNRKIIISILILMFAISLLEVFTLTGSVIGDVNLFIAGLPGITDIFVSNITESSVTITWETSTNANSTVDYGETEDLGLNATNTSLSLAHSIFLNSLNFSTVYFYNITSCSADGCSTNGINNFTTCTPTSSSCLVDSNCCIGYCVHGTCRATTTYCGDAQCDIDETYSICPADCTSTDTNIGGGGGGGGGGGVTQKITSFSISVDMIKILIDQGETKTIPIMISNNGTENLNINIELEGLEKYILIDKTSFSLNAGEEETIYLDISASETMSPDIYMGKLIMHANNIEQIVRLIVEVNEVKPLFDINVSVHSSSKMVDAGSFVSADIYMINLGKIEPTDVTLTYSIVDMDGNVYNLREETLAVNDEQIITRNLFLPFDVNLGYYIFYVKLTYDNQIATASDLFEVVPGFKLTEDEKLLVVITSSLIVSLIILIRRKLGFVLSKRRSKKRKYF